ncbi:SDR family oxidoreductase [Natrialba swarupiae]|nr:SDR family oxidoreductase [Natrialba swarupiae]
MSELTYDYSETTVVITGGSSGIGRAIAIRFAEAGATVLNGDIEREPKGADIPTDAAIEERGGTAEYVETDVTERADLEALVEYAGEYGGST